MYYYIKMKLNNNVLSKLRVLKIIPNSNTFTTCKVESNEPRKGLVLGAYQCKNGELELTPAAARFNDVSGGRLKELCVQAGREIKRGSARIFHRLADGYFAVAVAGLGLKNEGFNSYEGLDQDRENVRIAAAVGAKKLLKQACHHVCMDGMDYAEQAAEGGGLAVWRYQDNKNKDDWEVVPSLELFDDPNEDAWQRGLFKAESQNLVRRLCEAPANQMTPFDFAQETVNQLCPCNVKVTVHDRDWIETKKMKLFLTVAKGSCVPPLFIEIYYAGGAHEDKPILFVGKGITFDAGGLCLKSCRHMSRHRGDMAGAACIVSTIRAAAALTLPINIAAVLPLCENMISGMAMKAGDIVFSLNKKSVQIEDTDNAGRLCLADALVYGQNAYKPRLIIDVSTSSRGITTAIGGAATGLYSNSHAMWKEIYKAGAVTGDRMWRMPLWNYYTKNVTKGRTTDVENQGIGKGDSCLAAAFLQEFICDVDWMHLDINGTGLISHDKHHPYLKRGRMSGRPTRTLIQLMYQLAKPSKDK